MTLNRLILLLAHDSFEQAKKNYIKIQYLYDNVVLIFRLLTRTFRRWRRLSSTSWSTSDATSSASGSRTQSRLETGNKLFYVTLSLVIDHLFSYLTSPNKVEHSLTDDSFTSLLMFCLINDFRAFHIISNLRLELQYLLIFFV